MLLIESYFFCNEALVRRQSKHNTTNNIPALFLFDKTFFPMIQSICQNLWNLLVADIGIFCHDMSTLPWTTQIWALLFPFPQFILGLASVIFVGISSIGAWYLYCRIVSFVMAGQIHKRYPFSKMMGPIMHLPLYGLLPIAIRWIYQQHQPQSSSSNVDVVHNNDTKIEEFHFGFVVFTTIISSISLVLDGSVALKWLIGTDVGSYDRHNNHSRGAYQPVMD
jgi:hypothetical protein